MSKIQNLIQELHSENLLNTEIAKIIDKSPDTVAYYLKKLNLINNRNKNSVNNKNLIIKLLKDKNTVYSIEKLTNCSSTFIRKIARDNNINTQTKTQYISKIKLVKHNPFINLKDKSVNYWLGFLAADGSIYEDRLSLGLQECDINHLYKYKQFINCNLKIIKTIKDNKYIGYSASFRNKEVIKFLYKLGITNKKTSTLNIKINITKDFIRGVIDGDGYIRKKGKEITITTASKTFSKQLHKSFIDIFNIEPKIYNTTSKIGTPIYNVTILGKHKVKKVLNELYINADTYLKRKYDTAVLISNS